MKMTLVATLNSKLGDFGKFGTYLICKGVKSEYIPAFYLAFLNAMRDANTCDFYEALSQFTDEDKDKMHDFFNGGEEDD